MGRKLAVVFPSLFVCLLLLASVPLPQALADTPIPKGTPQVTTTPIAVASTTTVPTVVVEPTRQGSPSTTVTPLVTTTASTTPQAEAVARAFPETGFTVPATFIKYWDANGGLSIFGFPISTAHQETSRTDGKSYLVQYFERNRFELHPELKEAGNEVLLGLLGVELTRGRTFDTVQPFTNTPSLVYFEATKHSLGEPFLSYWKEHGGLALFGYPISEPFNEKSNLDGKSYLVQYFERNRFEFHPENKAPYDVLLGLLGKDYMELQSTATAWGTQIPGGMPITQPIWKAVKPAAGGKFLTGPTVGDGLDVQMYWQDHDRILNTADDLGFNWITQQVEWKEAEEPKGAYTWTELDSIVNDTQRHNIKILISVVKAPEWATGGGNGFPKDPKDLQDFMQAMATHFKGRVHAYMIWNEQNLTGEAGVIDPGRYVELLKAGYLGVKSVDPSAIVLSGALAPTGVNDPEGKRAPGAMGALSDLNYLEAMYKYHDGEMRAYYDVVGTHPYGFNNPPEMSWPDNPNMNPEFPKNDKGVIDFYNRSNSFYFRRIEQQRAIMEKYGDGQKQMWVTEYGWCSDQRPDGYGECKYNTPEQQGEYIVRAMQFSRKYYPWMGVMFIWNLNFSIFQPWYTGPAHYSILNGDWSARPAYFIIKNRPKQ